MVRHGECPRYADVPYAWLDWSAPLHGGRWGGLWAIPLYYLLILGV